MSSRELSTPVATVWCWSWRYCLPLLRGHRPLQQHSPPGCGRHCRREADPARPGGFESEDRRLPVCEQRPVYLNRRSAGWLGQRKATMGELIDTLYTSWSKDPVHSDKSAYNRIAVGLVHILSRKVQDGDLRNYLNPR